MKNQLLILITSINGFNCFAQLPIVNCNNVTYYADTVYVSISNNILPDTIYYNDTLGIAYPAHCLLLSDTSVISATTTFSSDSCFIFTGLQQNSFDDTINFEYLITFHSTTFSNNTIVNGYFHLSKITGNDTLADCYFPVTIILQNTIAIMEVTANEKIKIYPNPVADELNIRNNSAQLVGLTLYNSLGEKIIDKNLSGKINTLNLAGYSNGIYYYKVILDFDVIKSGKIIKM